MPRAAACSAAALFPPPPLPVQFPLDGTIPPLMPARPLLGLQEGMLAMYKGLLPRLMRIAPGQAIVWTVNDQIVQMFEKRQLAEAS